MRRASAREGGGALRRFPSAGHGPEWPRSGAVHLSQGGRHERRRGPRTRPTGTGVRLLDRPPADVSRLTATQAASRARRVAEGARTRFAIHAERGEALAEERAHQLPVPRARLRVVDLERRAVVPVRPRDSALLCFLADGASPRDARGGVGLIDCPGTGGSPGKGAATCVADHAFAVWMGRPAARSATNPQQLATFLKIDRRRSLSRQHSDPPIRWALKERCFAPPTEPP
jgi:hypothetical protein